MERKMRVYTYQYLPGVARRNEHCAGPELAGPAAVEGMGDSLAASWFFWYFFGGFGQSDSLVISEFGSLVVLRWNKTMVLL